MTRLLKNKKILIISPEQWGSNYVSKHHYANYLSRHNDVFFLNPPQPWKIQNLVSRQVQSQHIHQGLTTVNYPYLFPKINALPQWLQEKVFRKQAHEVQKQLNVEQFDVIWSFTPLLFWNLRAWNSKKYLYHTVDFHPHAKYEDSVCQEADAVVGVADLILDPLRGYSYSCHKVGHGADIIGFTKNSNQQLASKKRITAGYVGNFHGNIDYELLLQLVRNHPNVFFQFIGPYENSNLSDQNNDKPAAFHQLFHCENTEFVGPVHSDKLIQYLDQFDINLVLFKDEKHETHCNPHKMMGYFYTGNVTVSSYIDEYKDKRELLQMADSNRDIPTLFAHTLDNLLVLNNEENKQMRRQYAEQSSYDRRIEHIAELLNVL